MPTVVGVRFRYASKTLMFDPAGTEPAAGDAVIVSTERGDEIGTVAQAPFEVADSELAAPLKPILRVATEVDLAAQEELEAKEAEAMPVFRQLVAERGLEMKPVGVEYLFGGDKVVFYFSAEDRVDFRELVRELASRFKARIDMRQIGVRDEARLVGGVGHCGEPLCCVRFGGEFHPVSIRMAKEQDLPLNPLKISGLCGRLMCCLRYEYDAYKDFKSRAPKRGAIIDTPLGLAKVSEMNTPRETIGMRLEDGKPLTVPLAKMECSKGTGCPCSVSREALEEVAPAALVTSGPVPQLEQASESAGSRRRQKPAASQKSGSEPAAAPSGEQKSARRRRRGRGGSGGGQEGAPQQKQAASQPPASSGDASGGGESGGRSTSGRRRRRRRRPEGGSSGSA